MDHLTGFLRDMDAVFTALAMVAGLLIFLICMLVGLAFYLIWEGSPRDGS